MTATLETNLVVVAVVGDLKRTMSRAFCQLCLSRREKLVFVSTKLYAPRQPFILRGIA